MGGRRKAAVSYLTVKYISVAGPNRSKALPDLCLPSHPPGGPLASAASLKRLNRAALVTRFCLQRQSRPQHPGNPAPLPNLSVGVFTCTAKDFSPQQKRSLIFGWLERVKHQRKTHPATYGYCRPWDLGTGWALVSSPELNDVKSTDSQPLTVHRVGELHSALTAFFSTGGELVTARTGLRTTRAPPGTLRVFY